MTPAGGIERVIATLANKFSEFLDVTILVKDAAFSHYPLSDVVKLESLDNEIKLDLDSKINRIVQAGKNVISSRNKLRRYLLNNHFDYFYIAHPLNALEFHLAKRINKKVIVTEHGGIDAYNAIYKGIKKWLYPKSQTYVVPTKTDTKLYEEMGLPSMYIPHFRSELKYLKSPQDKQKALTIGRMTEAKRQWILIDLWDKIVHDHKILNWQLNIVGDGNLKAQYLKKIEKLKLEEYVKVLLPKQEVEDFYKDASFFLLTSKSEGFGMVILEAMSFGVPCISYDCPSGPRDMISDNVNGFLIKMDSFEGLKSAVLEMINNKDKMLTFGDRAYQASKNWDDESILVKWKKLLS